MSAAVIVGVAQAVEALLLAILGFAIYGSASAVTGRRSTSR